MSKKHISMEIAYATARLAVEWARGNPTAEFKDQKILHETVIQLLRQVKKVNHSSNIVLMSDGSEGLTVTRQDVVPKKEILRNKDNFFRTSIIRPRGAHLIISVNPKMQFAEVKGIGRIVEFSKDEKDQLALAQRQAEELRFIRRLLPGPYPPKPDPGIQFLCKLIPSNI